ncbi:MAG: ribonuclease HI family protein [Chloroflexota bacterium]
MNEIRKPQTPPQGASGATGAMAFDLSLSGAMVEKPDYTLVFDGGSLGNPGPGYGSYALFRHQDGKSRVVRLDLGPDMTNNEAEYDALLAGLEDLLRTIEKAKRDPGQYGLEVRGDSELVIKQLMGRWKAKNQRMRARRNRAMALMQRFKGYRLVHQPREDTVKLLGH